ncbi:MAG: hypothetical protein ACE5E1_01135 [Phycisphaerae bacterium]
MPAVEHTGEGKPETPAPATRPTISRRRRFLAALLTFLVFSLLAAGFLETVFRLFVPVTDAPVFFWDPLLGPRRMPNQTGRYILRGKFDGRYHFNAQGWNDPRDYVLPKPAGTRRVCLVGDSMVEALGVDTERSMAIIAEDRMNRPDRPVEWYAFACSGWGPCREYMAIRHYVLDYQPDVVLMMFVQNDPFDCSPYIANLSDTRPRCSLSADGELVWQRSRQWVHPWPQRLAIRSAVARYFMLQTGLWGKWRTRGHTVNVHAPLEESTRTYSADSQAADRAARDERGEKTWLLIEKLFEETRDECRARGATFAVVFRGHYERLHAVARGEAYTPLPRDVDPYCLGRRQDDMGDDFLRPITERLNIPYLDLTETLSRLIRETGQLHHPPNDTHFNVPAHAAAGAAMGRWVEALWSAEANGPRPTGSRAPVSPADRPTDRASREER